MPLIHPPLLYMLLMFSFSIFYASNASSVYYVFYSFSLIRFVFIFAIWLFLYLFMLAKSRAAVTRSEAERLTMSETSDQLLLNASPYIIL